MANVQTTGYIFRHNEASIFLATDNKVSNKIKHIGIREHFIIECVDEVRTKLKKVRSENNSSNIMTKIHQRKLSNESERNI